MNYRRVNGNIVHAEHWVATNIENIVHAKRWSYMYLAQQVVKEIRDSALALVDPVLTSIVSGEPDMDAVCDRLKSGELDLIDLVAVSEVLGLTLDDLVFGSFDGCSKAGVEGLEKLRRSGTSDADTQVPVARGVSNWHEGETAARSAQPVVVMPVSAAASAAGQSVVR